MDQHTGPLHNRLHLLGFVPDSHGGKCCIHEKVPSIGVAVHVFLDIDLIRMKTMDQNDLM